MQIIVTRPEDDAPGLAAKIAATGHDPVLSPLMRIVGVRDAVIPQQDWQAVALTSANALKVLRGDPRLARLVHHRAYVVGPASAAAAFAAGFRDVHVVSGGDLPSLVQLIARVGDGAAGPILYLSGAQISGDLAGQLAGAGFTVSRAVVYEAVPTDRLDARAIATVRSGQPAGVVLYSVRSAKLWRMLAHGAGLGGMLSRVVHFCLSPAVAAVLDDSMPRRLAWRPDEKAMLELIAEAET